jgi:sialate O-acetylesterase
MRRLLNSAFLILTLAAAAKAEVTLAPLFTDHAVLQRDKPLPVWGHAAAGEKITVTFRGESARTTAGADGRWIASLDPLAANAEGADLVVSGQNTVTLHDVLVGEVWLASGQSNMEFPVYDPKSTQFHLQNAAAEVAAAKFPLLRQFLVSRTVAEQPIDTAKGAWDVCSPETVGRFSAVAYFFARDLHEKLNVPVGIIDSTWGGTPVESWMSPAAIASNPAFAVVGQRWQKNLADYPAKRALYETQLAIWTRDAADATAQGPAALAAFLKKNPKQRPPRGPGDSWTPTSLFNGMINPLLPYALRGAIWYQGESNAERASEYHVLFAAMITAWRAHFGQGDFPFYWVNLASYGVPGDPTNMTYAFLREAQTQTLALPNSGQALAIDLGDRSNIHPANKQDVGHRLALLARTRVYGFTGDDTGPTFTSATREGSALRVRFSHASGLIAHDKPVQSLELAGADKKFHPATAKIVGDSLLVSSPLVREPVAVRYAFTNFPEANLYNGTGLPAVPFRSDDW